MANPERRGRDLLDELYPYFEATGAARGPAWATFFLEAGPADDPLFSHQTRVAATAGVKAFYAADVTQRTAAEDRLEGLRNSLPPEFARVEPAGEGGVPGGDDAPGPYLLGPQSDRVAMAHGVEAPLPVPRSPDLRALGAPAARGEAAGAARQDRGARPRPHGAARRHRRADEAAVPSPEAAPFFEGNPPEWVDELLSPGMLDATGLFDPAKVAGLVRRCRAGRATGYREGMALVGVLSTQVWHERFCGPHADVFPPEEGEPQVFIKQGIDQALERV